MKETEDRIVMGEREREIIGSEEGGREKERHGGMSRVRGVMRNRERRG